MKAFFIFLIGFVCSVWSHAQTPITFEALIDTVDWSDVTETDVVFILKDNICKQEEANRKIGDWYTSYYIKNVQIGKYIVPHTDILVDIENRKVERINILFSKESTIWDNPSEFEDTLSNYFKEKLGDSYSKLDEFLGRGNKITTYTWDNYTILYGKLTIFFDAITKFCAISFGPGVK